MKKYIKFFIYGIIYIILILVFAVMFIVTTRAEIIKPNNGIEPYQVIKIQLRGLMENDNPKMDSGIEQTWEFAHPENQKYTGPLENFKKMLKGDSYSMLIDHLDHEVVEVYNNDKLATFEVTVLDKDKKYYKFKWQVEKYLGEGPLNNCWLTTAVSQPTPTGSSI